MGKRNGGSRGKDCEKLRPCIQIQPQEEVVLCDTDGPGMLTHLWFTGYVGHLLYFFETDLQDLAGKINVETDQNADSYLWKVQ